MGTEFYTKEKITREHTDGRLPNPIIGGFARFRNFEPFSEGGSCRLYSCLDSNLNRVVAYKTLHAHLKDNEQDVRRFLREARVTAQIQHPNTVPVYEIGRDDQGIPYFTMKKVHGDTLREIIEGVAGGHQRFVEQFPLEQRLEILHQVCQAIAFAHARGVIHRDLKPANILIGDFGEVIVLDWGLAKVGNLPEPHAEPSAGPPKISHEIELTRAGSRYGTPLYMSPEQARGIKDVDERCDVYLLGNLLYEILTLQNLVWGQDVDEILDRILNDPIIPPRQRAPERHIPHDLEAICLKALAKNPGDRYESVAAFMDDLRRFQRREPVQAFRGPWWMRLLKWRERHAVRLSSLSFFLLGAGISWLLYRIT